MALTGVGVLAGGAEVFLSNRRRLAGELRRLRSQAGLSGRQLAEQVGISQSKVSRIESGITIPTVPEVTGWAAAAAAPEKATELLMALTDAVHTEVHPWDEALREETHLQGDIQEMENRARSALTYEPSLVPGLLQTAEYARRVFTMFEPAYAELDIPAVVAARLDRQVALFDPSRTFEYVITEAALRWRPGRASVLLAQLDRIASLSTLGNVSIGLIPHTAEAVTHCPHGFTVFEPADGDGDGDALVMVETVHANLTVSLPGHVALYRRHWSRLQQMAVYGDAMGDLLTVVARDVRQLCSASESP